MAGGDAPTLMCSLHPGRHGRAIHPHLPAQLPVGPRPPAGPGEPGAAGPGLGRWGSDPATAPFTIEIPPSARPTLAKEGARHHGLPARLLAIAAGTGDVLMSRLTARGAAHFLRETGCAANCSRYGPTAGSTLMAWYPSAARWMSASPSPSASIKACYPCLDADSLLDGRRRRCGRNHLHSLPE